MELVLGFAIAVLIAITGVGAGSLVAPLLILFLHVPVAAAVGTALAYSAAVKLVAVPMQIWRKQVAWRTLGIILATGIPGVAIGSLVFQRVAHNPSNNVWLYLALGVMIVISSAWHIYRHFRPRVGPQHRSDAPGWLALVMLPIGAEVGFSSSGAGALGTLALLGLTPLDVRRVVGTDLAFGLCLSSSEAHSTSKAPAWTPHFSSISSSAAFSAHSSVQGSLRAFRSVPCVSRSHFGCLSWEFSSAGTRSLKRDRRPPLSARSGHSRTAASTAIYFQ